MTPAAIPASWYRGAEGFTYSSTTRSVSSKPPIWTATAAKATQPSKPCVFRDTRLGGRASRGRSGAPHRARQAMQPNNPATWHSSHAIPANPANIGSTQSRSSAVPQSR